MSSVTVGEAAAIFDTALNAGIIASTIGFIDKDLYSQVSVEAMTAANGYVTDQQKVQGAIDLIQTYGGGTVKFAQRNYSGLTNIVKRNNVNLDGASFSGTKLSQDPNATGPLILDYPYVGSSDSLGGKCWYQNLEINGNKAGLTTSRGDQTAGSPNITNLTVTSGLQADYIVEGSGIPNFTTCVSVNAGAGTLVLSANVIAAFTKVQNKLVFRKAFKCNVSSLLPSFDLTVNSGDITKIKVGMMVHGTNIAVDAVSLDDNTHVTAVNVATSKVTLDRVPAGSTTADVLFYVANEGVYFAELSYNPDSDSGKDYRAATFLAVAIADCSGNGVAVRDKRNQFIWDAGKCTGNYGANVVMYNTNDCKFIGGLGIGSGWKGNLRLVSCSTFRMISFDCFDEAMPEKFAGIMLIDNRQVTIAFGEINGTVTIAGQTHAVETNHGIRFAHINYKWHKGCANPDGTAPYFIQIRNGADVAFDNCYFLVDESDNSAPNYIIDIAGDSYCDLQRLRLITNVAEPTRPYKTGIALVADTSKMAGEYYDVSQNLVVLLHKRAGGYLDGVDPPVGAIGELLKTSISNGSPTALTTATITNLGSTTLTPGLWNVWAVVHFVLTGATGTKLEVGLPGNSATIPNGADGKGVFSLPFTGLTGEITVIAAPSQVKLSASGAQRFNVRPTFTVGTVSAYGAYYGQRIA